MIGIAGLAASFVGLGASLLACYHALRAARAGEPARQATVAIRIAFAAVLAANALMITALVGHDFSVAYVAEVGSRATPPLYTIASLWGALEGSILFWALLLAGITVLLTLRVSDADRPLLPVSLAVLSGLLAFFVFIVVGPGDPWRPVSPVPADGPGPNPLLANHPLMAIHPPLLYAGFVGLSVPFALTVAALWRGRLDDGWLRATRRWTLGAWISLTLGLVAGAWWSYAVLGWGGYWAWDPVENVALLPWLTATAFLHSAMVQARRGMLAGWNVVLVTSSFALTILATLVTRSGILNSVHAFTQSLVGPLFLALLAVVVVGSLGLIVLRLPPAAEPRRRSGPRVNAFLINNLLLVVAAASVLTGTLFPLAAEAFTGAQVSVGGPYFERVIGPIMLALLVLAGMGPSLPWNGWDAAARRRLLPGAVGAALVALAVLAAGGSAAGVGGIAVGVFALVQSAAYLTARLRRWRGVRRTRQPVPIRGLPRAIGGLVVHAGIAVMAMAIVASGAGQRVITVDLRPGASVRLGPYTVNYIGSTQDIRPDRTVLTALASAVGPAGNASLAPSLSVLPALGTPIAVPAIVASPLADLYVVLARLDPQRGTASLVISLHPLMSWLWVGGGIAAAGGLLAIWPVGRRREAMSVVSRATSAAIDGL